MLCDYLHCIECTEIHGLNDKNPKFPKVSSHFSTNKRLCSGFNGFRTLHTLRLTGLPLASGGTLRTLLLYLLLPKRETGTILPVAGSGIVPAVPFFPVVSVAASFCSTTS